MPMSLKSTQPAHIQGSGRLLPATPSRLWRHNPEPIVKYVCQYTDTERATGVRDDPGRTMRKRIDQVTLHLSDFASPPIVQVGEATDCPKLDRLMK